MIPMVPLGRSSIPLTHQTNTECLPCVRYCAKIEDYRMSNETFPAVPRAGFFNLLGVSMESKGFFFKFSIKFLDFEYIHCSKRVWMGGIF